MHDKVSIPTPARSDVRTAAQGGQIAASDFTAWLRTQTRRRGLSGQVARDFSLPGTNWPDAEAFYSYARLLIQHLCLGTQSAWALNDTYLRYGIVRQRQLDRRSRSTNQRDRK